MADAVLDALEAAGHRDRPGAARRRGYASARWPGRLELLDVTAGRGARDVLLDGAHNPAGAAALARARRPAAVPRGGRRPPVRRHARLGVDGRQGRRGRRRARSRARRPSRGATVIAHARSTCRGRCRAAELAAALARGRSPARASVEAAGPGAPPSTGARDRRRAGRRRRLAVPRRDARARLVDDPLLRDPVAA